MIETLRIEGMAIVERAELEFAAGLNVLTGETGAGKSIVLGALALLAGGRATVQTVRDGDEEAVVEAVFDTSRLPDLENELAQRGIECDEHELIATRTLSRAGRSRARIGGRLVPVATLAEVFAGRLEISSQHGSQALLRPEHHGRLLDRSAGIESVRAKVAEGFAAVRRLDEELAVLRAEAQERARRQDFLGYQVEEIDCANLDVDEIERLRANRSRWAHAGRLQQEGGGALEALSGDSDGHDGGVTDRLARVVRTIEGLTALDAELGPMAERFAGLQDELRDAAFDLERHLSGIESDPARLAAAEDRLHQVEQLQRKYGESVEAVLAFRERTAAELATFEGAEEREAEIIAERAQRVEALTKDAKRLSRGRAKAARSLVQQVEAELGELAMPQGRFAVELTPVDPPEGMPCGAGGAESPAFVFSANAGEALRPLRAVASGGELSRVFLALKQALRESDAGMVLVFDEVDAGIGGRVADRVGRMLAELAAHHQVLCITHLPQIAAFAQNHFRVEKREVDGRTQTRIARVDGSDRVEEIARMAGGESIGEATLAHARELLASRSVL
ncbi:MAG: DNA repair protein RecN [Deltaproteobacteria bacterium]|nr:DNA repair protein RecN [Deltaproteobacteria bacterium]MBW2397897.1 DNA repair protein RecN [Deltaproteobacteria bacterium]